MPEFGSKTCPYETAPENWKEDGVPYASWCLCSKCGYVSQSTYVFDFYADKPGDPLVCEFCELYGKEK